MALAYLTDPKAKLTNRFRKECKRARETLYMGTPPKDGGEKLARKLATLPILKVRQMLGRSILRRREVQRVWEKTPPSRVAVRMLLDIKAQAFDLLADQCTAELYRRAAIVEQTRILRNSPRT